MKPTNFALAENLKLQAGKARMQSEEVKRNAVIEQGGRAYRMGIEKRNCPLNDDRRALWEMGWDRAEQDFKKLFPGRA